MHRLKQSYVVCHCVSQEGSVTYIVPNGWHVWTVTTAGMTVLSARHSWQAERDAAAGLQVGTAVFSFVASLCVEWIPGVV